MIDIEKLIVCFVCGVGTNCFCLLKLLLQSDAHNSFQVIWVIKIVILLKFFKQPVKYYTLTPIYHVNIIVIVFQP